MFEYTFSGVKFHEDSNAANRLSIAALVTKLWLKNQLSVKSNLNTCETWVGTSQTCPHHPLWAILHFHIFLLWSIFSHVYMAVFCQHITCLCGVGGSVFRLLFIQWKEVSTFSSHSAVLVGCVSSLTLFRSQLSACLFHYFCCFGDVLWMCFAMSCFGAALQLSKCVSHVLCLNASVSQLPGWSCQRWYA